MAVMSIEPNVFEQPTVVARYDAVTVEVPVYQATPARRPPAAPARRRSRLALGLFVFAALIVAWGAAAYDAWAVWR